MANTRRKRLPGQIVPDSPPRKRGRPQTRPERTTQKREYHKSGRYTKEKKAERALRKTRRAEFLSDMKLRNMHGKEGDELFANLERRRGGRKGFVTPVLKEEWQRRGRKAKIANNVPFGGSSQYQGKIVSV